MRWWVALFKWIIRVAFTGKVLFEQMHDSNECRKCCGHLCGKQTHSTEGKKAAKALRWELVCCIQVRKTVWLEQSERGWGGRCQDRGMGKAGKEGPERHYFGAEVFVVVVCLF